MYASEKDKTPMLSAMHFKSDDQDDSRSETRIFSTRMRSLSMSIPANVLDSSEQENNLVGFTGPLKNGRQTVQMSGPLYISRNHEVIFQPPQIPLEQNTNEPKLDRYPSIDGMDNNDWPLDNYEGKNDRLLKSGQLGMCNDPYCTTCPTYYNVKGRQKHSRTSEIFDAKDYNLVQDSSCIALPEFHNMLYGDAKGCARRMCSFLQPYIPGVMNPHAKVVQQWNKFFVISCLFAVFLDPLFFFLLSVQQFRLAYVAPESRVMGSGDLVDDPKKLPGITFLDILSLICLWCCPFPRLYRFLPLLAGQSPTGFIFESAWANFVINLLTFVLASHVVGSCWYLFGLQVNMFQCITGTMRVNQCLRDACHGSNITRCMEFIDCGHGNDFGEFENDPTWDQWKNNNDAIACFGQAGFAYGIYQNAVDLTTHQNQISTLAGNQVPSYFVWEVLFTMAIIGVGLLLFALLIGNMQNFLQALGRRRLEMSLRRRDVEQWMSHRRLPEELRRLILFVARHFIVRIFQLLDEPIIDAICERLRTKTYIKGSKILCRGGLVDKMVFIIRGKMESIGEDLTVLPLLEGDVCGEELLTWCLEHSSVNKGMNHLIGEGLQPGNPSGMEIQKKRLSRADDSSPHVIFLLGSDR
ncbi:putative cyclic nucleotide-gated ion channel 20, chloroplastic [Sesamum angolense]|uniref:Cyclic nucleotide-gated ion channel 20, chloroplastic n=1 Tax=Sesamum angolense TaxID=2727404 RepID=A0AAE2BRB6_9LAMI|nr:putative cyclic nucleotide-gated ion channel 20, chloroplastic [Sesamum angolense]